MSFKIDLDQLDSTDNSLNLNLNFDEIKNINHFCELNKVFNESGQYESNILNQEKSFIKKYQNNFEYKCEVRNCFKKFKQKQHLNRHLLNDHKIDNRKLPIDCLNCESKFRNRKDLVEHLNKVHEEEIVINKREFVNFNDFQNFKSNLEKETLCKFVKHYSENNVCMYQCSRSGDKRVVNDENRKYDQSFKESSKTGHSCTAYIKLELISEGK